MLPETKQKKQPQSLKSWVFDIWFSLTRPREEFSNYLIQKDLTRQGLCVDYYYEQMRRGVEFPPPPPIEVMHACLEEKLRLEQMGIFIGEAIEKIEKSDKQKQQSERNTYD